KAVLKGPLVLSANILAIAVFPLPAVSRSEVFAVPGRSYSYSYSKGAYRTNGVSEKRGEYQYRDAEYE
ncbi:MAG: hypothetical protein U0996_24470, partial [Planctomycetaceae bacterium]